MVAPFTKLITKQSVILSSKIDLLISVIGINNGNKKMNKYIVLLCTTVTLLPFSIANAQHNEHPVSDQVIQAQRLELKSNTQDKDFGPQSPRDIDHIAGTNPQSFSIAPLYTKMNLCNIHFHKNAEHKGGEFTQYAGNGDGKGNNSGYKYSGTLTKAELTPTSENIGKSEHTYLIPGDTIEVHYVHSTANVKPGPTLASCLTDTTKTPLLRVETQVYVLVNDPHALDFIALTANAEKEGYQQALHIPDNSGNAIQYRGSTTGPSYNEEGSPYQVTWNVRPEVLKVDINTVGRWLQGNIYDENHAHGVRNLVINPTLLSAN